MIATELDCGGRTLVLDRPRICGIVNLTDDSFSGDGLGGAIEAAVQRGLDLVAEGADLLDIGGESTRPGARSPSPQEELGRVLPVLRHALGLGVPVSVDTSRPVLMRAALDLGADIVNDVRALTRPGALDVLASHPQAGVCLMHMQGEPGDMQRAPHYDDVVAEVVAFLQERVRSCVAAGVDRRRIVVDPGIGFGKTADHNLALLARQCELQVLALPLLVGWSRKSTLGQITGRPVQARVAASVAAALLCVQRGASIVRVHDVAPTVDALKVWRAVGAGATG